MPRLILSMILSLAAYGLIFGTVIHRPLTRGVILDLLDVKLAHLEAATGPQIVVLAGSNARFSHSCAVLSERLGRPCTNMGIAAGTGLDLLLEGTLAGLEPGDLVYLPLEYGQYGIGRQTMLASAETGERFHRDPGALLQQRGWEGLLHAFFSFDLSTGIQGALEMGFQALGGRRRFGTDTVNAMGDETGHTAGKASEYEGVLAAARLPVPTAETLFGPGDGGAREALERFIAGAIGHGARVVGGLPTTPDAHPVPDDVITSIEAFYTANGAEFLILPSRSRYPLSDFYDTLYHLDEETQARHSRALADEFLRRGLVRRPGG